MSGVEVGLAIVSAVDLCFKYGKLLVEAYSTYKATDSEIAERVLRLEINWYRTTTQLDLLRKICKVLDKELQRIQNETLQVLIGKLRNATTKIQSVTKPGKDDGKQAAATNQVGIRRFKYVILKESVDKAIEELEMWQKMFDPSWYLIMKAAEPQIDSELSAQVQTKTNHSNPPPYSSANSLRNALKPEAEHTSGIFLSEHGIPHHPQPIRLTLAEVAERKNDWLILDKLVPPSDAVAKDLVSNVRDIARRLKNVDPQAFGLLKCRGVVRHQESPDRPPSSFTFVFSVPDGLSGPQSLRQSLINGGNDHSLSDRFRIAQDLAKSVCSVHTFGFVHKNIRPETILLFQDESSRLGAPFLVGFQKFRLAGARTVRMGGPEWEQDLYRHPRRMGQRPQDDYIMQHDIYSLGVCLLEVGLWGSFVDYDKTGTSPTPAPTLQLQLNDRQFKQPLLMKEHLQTLARKALPRRMGTKYAKIVETCLTCLDENNADFGDEGEFQDEDGILVGVRYIEKVLLQLNDLNV